MLDDLWALSLGGSFEWTALVTNGGAPGARDFSAVAWDDLHDRMLVQGGNNDFVRAGTWMLDIGGEPTPVFVSTLESKVAPDRVELRWRVSDAQGPVDVARAEAGGGWVVLGSARAGSEAEVDWIDRHVSTGTEYHYRLQWSDRGGLRAGGETSVRIPGSWALGLAAPRLVRGDRALVEFTLPATEPARIEVLDVTGRRVLVRDVGAPGAGRGQLELALPAHGTSGAYWIRLHQRGASAQQRLLRIR